MTGFDFLEARRVILSNVQTDSNLTWFHFWSMTSQRWDELFWEMLETTSTWPDFTYGKFAVVKKTFIKLRSYQADRPLVQCVSYLLHIAIDYNHNF